MTDEVHTIETSEDFWTMITHLASKTPTPAQVAAMEDLAWNSDKLTAGECQAMRAALNHTGLVTSSPDYAGAYHEAMGAVKTSGHPWGHYYVGLHHQGEGGEIEPHLAREHLMLAAEAGVAPANIALGLHYFRGDDDDANWPLSYTFMCRAADSGMALGLYYKGWWLEQGRGCAPDPVEAGVLYRQALRMGLKMAREGLDRLELAKAG